MKAMGTMIGLCGALCWLGCPAANPPAEGGRPAEAGSGEAVARVLLQKGEARATAANGFTFALRPECPLLRTDRLLVPAGGLLILALKNNYVVAVDEDQEIPVGSLVMLDEPATKTPVNEQLANLLRERNITAPERLAGWRQGMVAAETVPVQAARDEAQVANVSDTTRGDMAKMGPLVTGLRETESDERAMEKDKDSARNAETPSSPPQPAPKPPAEKPKALAPQKAKEAAIAQDKKPTGGASAGASGALEEKYAQLGRQKLEETKKAHIRMKPALAGHLKVAQWSIHSKNLVESKLASELPESLRGIVLGPEVAACLSDVDASQKKIEILLFMVDTAIADVRTLPNEDPGTCMKKAIVGRKVAKIDPGKLTISIEVTRQ
jgi:hypothetical protein